MQWDTSTEERRENCTRATNTYKTGNYTCEDEVQVTYWERIFSDRNDEREKESATTSEKIDISCYKCLILTNNFMNMVIDMKILGATEFINSFKELVKNNFNIMDTKITNNNVSLDDVHGETRDVVAFLSIISSRDRDDEEYQILQSDRMKRAFLIDIKNMMKKSDLKLYKKIENTYICGNK